MADKKSVLEKWNIIQKIEFDPDLIEEQVQKSVGKMNETQPVSGVSEEESIRFGVSQPVPAQEDEETGSYYEGEQVDIDPDKFTSVQELYAINRMEQGGRNTIFIIDNYNKALPDSLPVDLKRETVLNILKASNLQLDFLLKDGRDRMENLDRFIEMFSDRTDKVVLACENEIKRLQDQIQEYRSRIENRKRLQQKQTATVEYETKRLEDIITFIKN